MLEREIKGEEVTSLGGRGRTGVCRTLLEREIKREVVTRIGDATGRGRVHRDLKLHLA